MGTADANNSNALAEADALYEFIEGVYLPLKNAFCEECMAILSRTADCATIGNLIVAAARKYNRKWNELSERRDGNYHFLRKDAFISILKKELFADPDWQKAPHISNALKYL